MSSREKYIDGNFDRDLEVPRDEISSKVEEEFVKMSTRFTEHACITNICHVILAGNTIESQLIAFFRTLF